MLATHPAVAEGAVVAAPDTRYGEVVAAVVVLEPGALLGLDELRAHFAESGLARQKTPERLVIVDALPRAALGKVRKADLRAAHFPSNSWNGEGSFCCSGFRCRLSDRTACTEGLDIAIKTQNDIPRISISLLLVFNEGST
ncbi:hypothetical protein GCM10020255_013180 [Rhodococcus baikonurensis]